MTKKQLPPQLVEKMYWAISDNSGQKCAKIAVDYAEEEKEDLVRCLEHVKLFLNGTSYAKTQSEERFDILENIDKLLGNDK